MHAPTARRECARAAVALTIEPIFECLVATGTGGRRLPIVAPIPPAAGLSVDDAPTHAPSAKSIMRRKCKSKKLRGEGLRHLAHCMYNKVEQDNPKKTAIEKINRSACSQSAETNGGSRVQISPFSI